MLRFEAMSLRCSFVTLDLHIYGLVVVFVVI